MKPEAAHSSELPYIEAVRMRAAVIEGSLDENKWVTPLSLSEANNLVQDSAFPLLDKVKEGLSPFMNEPQAYTTALNQALDEQVWATRQLGIIREYEDEKWRIGTRIAPKLKRSFFDAYWNYARQNKRPFLEEEVFKAFSQMYEITERSILWPAVSDAPNLKGNHNPFLPFVNIYQLGIVKLRFENYPNGQKIKLHLPIPQTESSTDLACWTEGSNQPDMLHGWEMPCHYTNKTTGV